MEPMAIRGEIVRLEPALGFGFIRDGQYGDWFFVTAGVRRGRLDDLRVGDEVMFSQEVTPSGPRATDVHRESAE